MGSLGDADGEKKSIDSDTNFDFSLAETQLFHSQSSPPSSSGDTVKCGDEDEYLFEQGTLPFYDDAPIEDANQTQLVNLVEETQVFEIDAETQLLDDRDFDDNVGTQVLDQFEDKVALDSDSDKTDITEFVCDSDEHSDDETERKGCIQSLRSEKIQQTSLCENDKGSMDQSIALDYGQISSESARNFTSVCTAASQASGLAAPSTDLKGTNGDCSPILTEVQFSDCGTIHSNEEHPEASVGINQNHDMGTYDGNLKGVRNGNNGRIGCQVARKLFNEKFSSENAVSCAMDNEDATEYLLEVSSDFPYAGLSYVDSQEPGELSQANALNFVERFLNDNLLECEIEIDHGKSTGRKSKPVSGAKGAQNLAKIITADKYTLGETAVFDWDDSHEDEGGGDFFVRKKEELFCKGVQARKSSTELRDPKGRRLSKTRTTQEQPNKDVQRMVNSDSKLVFLKSKENDKTMQEAGMSYKRNLFKEFSEQCNITSAAVAKRGAPDMLDVGVDTQMAAEAMEALFNEGEVENQKATDVQQDGKTNFKTSLGVRARNKFLPEQPLSVKRKRGCDACTPTTSQETKKLCCKESSVLLHNHCKNVMECNKEPQKREKKSSKSKAKERNYIIDGRKEPDKSPSNGAGQGKDDVALERSWLHESDKSCRTRRSTRCSSRKKQQAQEEVHRLIPVARRTRLSMLTNLVSADITPADSREGTNHAIEVDSLDKKNNSKNVQPSKVSKAKKELSSLVPSHIGGVNKVKLSRKDRSDLELIDRNLGSDALSYPKRKRYHRKSLVHTNESDTLYAQSKSCLLAEDTGHSINGLSSRSNVRRISIGSSMKKTRSSVHTSTVLASVDANSEGKLSMKVSENQHAVVVALPCNSAVSSGNTCTNLVSTEALKHTQMSRSLSSTVNESVLASTNCDKTPKEKSRPSLSCHTPVDCVTPTKALSPVCMGDEYFKQSCKKNISQLSFTKELCRLNSMEHEPTSPLKDTRKRRDLTKIQILFSQHLDDDIIKQQRKIVARLGMSEVSSILDATHFITDKFVRTRNMLEAIASGKPVVTHLWLQSIGQINTLIDEEAYILRDIKKEKELGFCMPVSLGRARKHPLLQGRKVLITPNTKPGKDTISGLAKAVQGQVVERLGRSALRNDKISDDLLILSCEVDYAMCLPFLEKGAMVYSSELLLNGIVTQKLEFERYRLFSEHVKRTRSSVWLRKNDKFLPVREHRTNA